VLRDAVSTALVERLGVTWDERYGQLKSYKDRFGDCNVPQAWKENPQLGSWVAVQRRFQSKGLLAANRKARLDELGFVWNILIAYRGANKLSCQMHLFARRNWTPRNPSCSAASMRQHPLFAPMSPSWMNLGPLALSDEFDITPVSQFEANSSRARTKTTLLRGGWFA